MLVSLEPASRRAAASAGQVFYTEISMHPCNQSLAQCSLAQAILAIKHTALACAEPGLWGVWLCHTMQARHILEPISP